MKVKCYRTTAYQNTDVLDARSIYFEDMGWHPEDANGTANNYVAIDLKDGSVRLMPHHFIISIEED
jgi:hypothetical protein